MQTVGLLLEDPGPDIGHSTISAAIIDCRDSKLRKIGGDTQVPRYKRNRLRLFSWSFFLLHYITRDG